MNGRVFRIGERELESVVAQNEWTPRREADLLRGRSCERRDEQVKVRRYGVEEVRLVSVPKYYGKLKSMVGRMMIIMMMMMMIMLVDGEEK